jgi:Uma2 family endonuclease
MTIGARFTSADLDRLPAIEGIRYEIIDGDLFVSKQPHWHHQYASDEALTELKLWNRETGLGMVISVPGLVFSDDNDVVPDVAWVSLARLAAITDAAGHLTEAPELVVEVVSPGRENERRDRVVKLALYARRGVAEYWIVDWQRRQVEVYRRAGDALALAETLTEDAVLTTELLPGFALPITRLWPPVA